MAEQKNIVIPLDEKSESILIGIIEKYQLQESDDAAFEKVQAHQPFNENVVIQLTRDLMVEKISNREFLEALHTQLEIPKETVKNLAIDIMHNLVPLLEKIPEDKLQEYNLAKQRAAEEGGETSEKLNTEQKGSEEYDKEAFKQTLLQKVRASVPLEPETEPEPEKSTPNLKKPEIEEVEGNAAKIQHTQQRQPEPVKAPEEKKPVDPYKEAIE